jgi:S1-C subfamily serine protease
MYQPDLNNQATAPNRPVPGAYRPGPDNQPDNLYWSNSQQVPTVSSMPPMPSNRPPSRGPRAGAILVLALVLAIVFGVGLFAGWQYGQGGVAAIADKTVSGLQTGTSPQAQPTIPALTGNNLEPVREAVVAKVRSSVVQVNVTLQRGTAIGSGVIIDKRGYIVTNDHVVQGAQNIDVMLADGSRLQNVQVVGTDVADDLAVLKINPPANMVVATLGDSSKLQVGQDVLAIGNPLGNTQTVTSGIVSALGRTVRESNSVTIPNAIQTDAPINPGNSGGALVDLQGNVIGIPTLNAIDPEFNAPANGVGFAIPSNRVQFIANQIIQTGQVTHTGRAVLGISAADVDATMAAQRGLPVNQGVLIANVQAGGPAAKAGLQSGDVIVQIDNKTINDLGGLQDALIAKNPGDTVSVKVYRGNQQLTVTVTLGELQASQ